MAQDIVVEASHISKKFSKSLNDLIKYGFVDISKNVLGLDTHSEKLRKGEFWAVNDVSFRLKRGESLGIIGPNGSGKTTILKLINGILTPDKGEIKVKGKVGALIEVGAGFHPLLTGRENIYVNGAILGMSKKEIDKKFNEIVEFADIGDFLDAPVKTYSSGMFVRLGFSVAVHCIPNLMLIDEVLAVGDINFQSRCFNKLGELRKNGVSTVLISHSMMHVLGFCDKVLYINRGKMKYYGETNKAINIYQKDMMPREDSLSKQFGIDNINGSGKVRVTKIEFLDGRKRPVNQVKAGGALTLRIYYLASEDVGPIELDVAIVGYGGDMFFRTSSQAHKKELIVHNGNGYIDVNFKSIRANNQNLLFYVTLWRSDRTELFDWKRELPLSVVGDSRSRGKVLLDIDWINYQ